MGSTEQVPRQDPKMDLPTERHPQLPIQPLELTPVTLTSRGPNGTGATKVPRMLYGTAWKGKSTTDLVYKAIRNGFRGIDTAAQRKHYNQPGVGFGIQRAIDEGFVTREELHIQTKFSSQPDEASDDESKTSLEDQIKASIATSLVELFPSSKTSCTTAITLPTSPTSNSTATPQTKPVQPAPYINTYLLHIPLPTLAQTLHAWSILITQHPSPLRTLGISNIDLKTLTALLKACRANNWAIPSVVQNPFCGHADGWDVGVRELCRREGVVYEGFWVLTGNVGLMGTGEGSGLSVGMLRRSCGSLGPLSDMAETPNCEILAENNISQDANLMDGKEGSEDRQEPGYKERDVIKNAADNKKKVLEINRTTNLERTLQVTPPLAMYALTLGSDPNMCVMVGTKHEQRMKDDILGMERMAAWSREQERSVALAAIRAESKVAEEVVENVKVDLWKLWVSVFLREIGEVDSDLDDEMRRAVERELKAVEEECGV